MQIKRLKLSGFKSFVEPAELRIERGLTGIVGPNGCGKSNLLEAIRWAMGESSSKSLRGSGMDDVIFAGTASRPPRDFAEVSMLIDLEPLEEGLTGESEVTRRIERGAGSAYRIDGRDVRAKDVGLLFADAATGPHSPALVSQGKIGAVIAAKPVERRQLLEEAAGISGLHARRKDAEQKLRATEANLVRLGEILGDQDQRSAQLRRQARAAERYRKLTQQIRLSEARLLHSRWRHVERDARMAANEADAAAQEVGRVQLQIEASQAAHEQASAAVAQTRTKLAKIREEAHVFAHQLAAARARRDTVGRRLAELDRLDAALASDAERERALQGDARSAISQLELEGSLLGQRLADGETSSALVATELKSCEAASREAETVLAELLAREAAMRAERRLALATLEATRAQLGRIEQEHGKLAQQLSSLGDGNQETSARTTAAAAATRASELMVVAEALRLEAEQRRTSASQERDQAESELASHRAALAAARSEHEALSRALEHGTGALIASLEAAPGYERALAAALGDDADASIGTAGARRWEGSEATGSDPKLPDGTLCLADHVRAPPELIRRLRQVAVAEEDTGEVLLVGQRLVTPAGRLRRWDGFVAIGSGAAAAERLIRANRLTEITSELPGLVAAIDQAEQRRDQIVAVMDECRRTLEEARTSAMDAERQRREATRAMDASAAALERLSAQRESLIQRQADLEPVIAAAHEAVGSAEAALAALPDPAALLDDLEAARNEAARTASHVANKRAQAASRAREAAADRERLSVVTREQSEWAKRLSDAEQRLAGALDRQEHQSAERAELLKEPAELDSTIAGLEQASEQSEIAISEESSNERIEEQALARAALEAKAAVEASADVRERRAAAAARAQSQQARTSEYERQSIDRFDCLAERLPDKLGFDPDDASAEDCARELEHLTGERERIGPVNLVAEQELAELDAARNKGAEEAKELTQAIHRLRGSIGNLNREGRVRLLEAYEKVDGHFRRLFATLFEGGQAHLELVESDDPLEAGLEIMAQPPGKRLSALTLLSGGEQALTAVALIFAIFLTNPAPICVLDEVDAPLDDANVERFCELLQRMSSETDTRYLIVTHNAVTMCRMDRLYGVTMIEQGISRLVSVDLGGVETLLAAE